MSSAAADRHFPLLIFIFFCSVSGAAFSFFIIFGPPVGHSFVLNYFWTRAFQAQFFAGDLYPRWLFEINADAGSPAFYFYGPLPFWISAITGKLLCPGCSTERAMMAGPSVLLALSGLSFYFWARSMVRPLAALLAASLYLILPYHFMIDLWYRQAIGEFAAYAWMPLILLGLERASNSPAYLLLAAVGYTALITSHLPSALIFSPLIVLFVLLRHRPAQWLPFIVIPVVLGIGLAGIYLVPALTTQDYINAAAWWNADEGHYDPLNWLWLDGHPAPVPGFANNILLALLPPTTLSLILAAVVFYQRESGRLIAAFAVLSLAYAWFLMTYPSSFLWSQITMLSKVQFPWRLGIVVDLCAATLFAVWLGWSLARKRFIKSTLCAVAIAVAVPYAYNVPSMYRHLWEAQDESQMAAARQVLVHGEDALEYRTVWSVRSSGQPAHVDLSEELAKIPHARIVSGSGAVSDFRHEVDRFSLTVEATMPVVVRFRRFFYPGWRLMSIADGRAIAVSASAELGLLEAALAAGSHRLVLERQSIEEERMGGVISLASLAAGLLFLAVVLVKRRPPASS